MDRIRTKHSAEWAKHAATTPVILGERINIRFDEFNRVSQFLVARQRDAAVEIRDQLSQRPKSD